jgi:hypothetical protein
MSRLPDLVLDSKLSTYFRGPTTIHSFLEINEAGGRSSREEHWEWKQDLGQGGFGQVRLEKSVTLGVKQDTLRAVKVINKQSNPSRSLDLSRELEAIAKFSNGRVSQIIPRDVNIA